MNHFSRFTQRMNQTLHLPSGSGIGAARYASVFEDGLFAGRRIWVTGGGIGIGRCVPTNWPRLAPFNGFHRAQTPEVLKP